MSFAVYFHTFCMQPLVCPVSPQWHSSTQPCRSKTYVLRSTWTHSAPRAYLSAPVCMVMQMKEYIRDRKFALSTTISQSLQDPMLRKLNTHEFQLNLRTHRPVKLIKPINVLDQATTSIFLRASKSLSDMSRPWWRDFFSSTAFVDATCTAVAFDPRVGAELSQCTQRLRTSSRSCNEVQPTLLLEMLPCTCESVHLYVTLYVTGTT